MKRADFLKSLALLPLAGLTMNLNKFKAFTDPLNKTDLMPVLFVGHGNPMNAIEDNEFTEGWQNISSAFPKPNAIICISAHWETKGTFLTVMEKPQTLHDFGGFPQSLFEVQYPALGSPELAKEAQKTVTITNIGFDNSWGLDHGAWSVIKRMYPRADIPVVQMSLDYNKAEQDHYDIGKQLSDFRKKGILIIGSGNMVHNLRMINWNQPDSGYDWAIESNEKLKRLIIDNDHKQVIQFPKSGQLAKLSVPTNEHFLPLLYALALRSGNDQVSFFNDKTMMGSLSMTSVKIG